MVSLLKALHATNQAEYQHSLLQAASRIVNAIGRDAVCEEQEHYAAFQTNMQALQERLLGAERDGRETLLVAGEVLQAMALYNQEITRKHEGTKQELRDVASMLTDAVQYACKGQERTSSGLRMLEKQIEGASKADDLRVIKTNLEHCLASVKTELDRQEQEHRDLTDLAGRIAMAAVVASADASIRDSVTGLPGRKAACADIKALLESAANDTHIICVRLGTLATINSNFGYDAGNEYLATVSRSIGKIIDSNDRLYRWTGPGFLIITDAKTSADQLQRALQRLNTAREGTVITSGARSMVVGVALSSVKYSLRHCGDTDSLSESVDQFISGQATPSRLQGHEPVPKAASVRTSITSVPTGRLVRQSA